MIAIVKIRQTGLEIFSCKLIVLVCLFLGNSVNYGTPVLAVSLHFRLRFFVKIQPVCKDTDCKDTAKTGVIVFKLIKQKETNCLESFH